MILSFLYWILAIVIKALDIFLFLIAFLSVVFLFETMLFAPLNIYNLGTIYIFLLIPLITIILYYINSLIIQSSSLKFAIILRLKIIIILSVTISIFVPGELILPHYYEDLRFIVASSTIFFAYEEFRRNYLFLKTNLYWRDSYIDFLLILGELIDKIWIIFYLLILIVMNPISPFLGTTKSTWIIIDAFTISVLWFSLIRDFKIGLYLYKEFFSIKKLIENKNEISLEKKKYVCEEYSLGLGLFSLPKINYSSENPQLDPSWLKKEEIILGLEFKWPVKT